MKPIPVLTCLCLTGLSSVCGTSKKVLDFLTYNNGDFDNKAQTQRVGDDHDFIQARFIPVDIKCLRPKPVYFMEEADRNVIRIFSLAVVTDGSGDTVSAVFYNFTDFSKYKPREFNVEILFNLSCEDLQEDSDCIASYRVTSDGYIFGNVPYCSVTVKGKHPRFTTVHTCDSATVTVPMYSDQASPIEPYEFKLTGHKYPLINPPPDYVSPCGK